MQLCKIINISSLKPLGTGQLARGERKRRGANGGAPVSADDFARAEDWDEVGERAERRRHHRIATGEEF